MAIEQDESEETLELVAAGNERLRVPSQVPLLAVRDLVIFPGATVPLAVGRPASLRALEAAGPDGFLVVATQRDAALESSNQCSIITN